MRKKLVGRDWQKQRVVQSILKDVRDDLHDDALVHRILHEKVSQDPAMQHETFGQRAADKLAAFAGSWLFAYLCGIAAGVDDLQCRHGSPRL